MAPLAGGGRRRRRWPAVDRARPLFFTVTVADTLGGASRSYTNPDLTAAAPIEDTIALPCQ
jgi:hypothetical protein